MSVDRLRRVSCRETDVLPGLINELLSKSDYKEILDYCVDLELRSVFWRYRNSKKIAIELQEKEARATDPTHLLNVSCSFDASDGVEG